MIVQTALGRRLQLRIAGHAVGLAERDRGQGMAVHRAVAEVVAVGDPHAAALEVVQPSLDQILEFALLMRVTRAEEGQQGETRGRGRAALAAGIGAVMLAGLGQVVEVPTAVLALMGGEPVEGPLDGLFALRGAAAVVHALAAAARRAAFEFVAHQRIDRLQQVGRRLAIRRPSPARDLGLVQHPPAQP